jgi:hypothetical protein
MHCAGQIACSLIVTAGSTHGPNNHCSLKNLRTVTRNLWLQKFILLVWMDLVFYAINKRNRFPFPNAVQ